MLSDVLIVAAAGRAPRIECTGGVAGRRTLPDTVHLISAAATPLGGDTIRVRVVVEPGAALAVRSAAATMVMPGAATMESRSHWELEVEGELDLDPQPTIVAGRARHVTSTRLTASAQASVRVRERIQIGRTRENQGFWTGSLYADVDGTPLLRHRIELGAGSVTDDELGTPLANVSELRYPSPAFDEAAGTLLELAAGGCLATWQGDRL
ncbi:urease accessory protein UreD [Mycolicibacterium sp. 050158]|jgi:urease accessory protein|uniref:urease accessory protein UreD n=1 Tax=Mycolicibacterium sp. 050158 TaxID=3090602 RepID=UPI00299E371D|nr:urease accessory protein UreD [Mycolicibacterium sp. 050158]MDX1891907.1 urease accessory protein UreD [Mycolicibacterium sp. 050158]